MQNVELKSFGNLRYCIFAEGGTETPHLGWLILGIGQEKHDRS